MIDKIASSITASGTGIGSVLIRKSIDSGKEPQKKERN